MKSGMFLGRQGNRGLGSHQQADMSTTLPLFTVADVVA